MAAGQSTKLTSETQYFINLSHNVCLSQDVLLSEAGDTVLPTRDDELACRGECGYGLTTQNQVSRAPLSGGADAEEDEGGQNDNDQSSVAARTGGGQAAQRRGHRLPAHDTLPGPMLGMAMASNCCQFFPSTQETIIGKLYFATPRESFPAEGGLNRFVREVDGQSAWPKG
ncbi:unnamed protein product [Protopolystoma xenopodis]|uniref:Uncharacterized protein n=1 Tax=Protopolystoma xenopodis TaxID=117903 RepID=A0A3S5CCB2_9PLAT|nr:unnamed protein product [Protopolystoma xenopodis]